MTTADELMDALHPNRDNPKVCSICYGNFTEFGNNAEPINDGRCCDGCNMLVVSARINMSRNRHPSSK